MKKIIISLSVLCTVLMSCVSEQVNYKPKTYQLTENNSGETLEVTVGDELNITLDDKSTTEEWVLIGTKRKQFLSMTRNETIDGKQFISFKVVGTGNVLLVFNYRRADELNLFQQFPSYVLIVKTEGIDK